jgi:hypothetical protein
VLCESYVLCVFGVSQDDRDRKLEAFKQKKQQQEEEQRRQHRSTGAGGGDGGGGAGGGGGGGGCATGGIDSGIAHDTNNATQHEPMLVSADNGNDADGADGPTAVAFDDDGPNAGDDDTLALREASLVAFREIETQVQHQVQREEQEQEEGEGSFSFSFKANISGCREVE